MASCRLFLLIFASLISFSPSVLAQQRASAPGDDVRVAPSEVVSGDYFAFGENVVISGTIDGDLYAAGGWIVVDGRVNGDVLAAGGRISLSGTVAQDVRAAGGQVTITGEIGRNLTVAGGEVELASSAQIRGGLVAAGGSVDVSAPVGRAARIAARSGVLASRIGGAVDAAAGRLRVASSADIRGELNYWSGREALVAEGARIQGRIVRNVPPERPGLFPAALFAWLIFIGVNFVSTLILGLLSVRFLPTFHQSVVTTLRERPGLSLATGLVAAVAVPVLCGLLVATVLAIPIGLILLAAFLLLLYWSRIYAIARIGEAILARLRPASGRAAAFVLGLFVYYALAIVPIIGWLAVPLVLLFGLGSELIARKRFYMTARSQDLL